MASFDPNLNSPLHRLYKNEPTELSPLCYIPSPIKQNNANKLPIMSPIPSQK